MVAQSIICQVSRGIETRTQVPDFKSTVLSTTCPVFLRLSLWIGEMGELIQSRKELECSHFIVPVSFVHTSRSHLSFMIIQIKMLGQIQGNEDGHADILEVGLSCCSSSEEHGFPRNGRIFPASALRVITVSAYCDELVKHP